MTSPSEYGLDGSLPIWLLPIFILGAIAFSIWSYSRTNPPVSRSVRLFLLCLRALGIIGGLIYFWQPVLRLVRTETPRPALAVLIDRSASMELAESGGGGAALDRLLSSPSFENLQRRFDVRLFGFADTAVQVGDWKEWESLPVGSSTNIGTSLLQAVGASRRAPVSGVLLVSDGGNNAGPDPVRAASSGKIPVWTVGVGATDRARDLMISGVVVNTVVYQGSKTPVELSYRAVGLPGESFEIELRDANGVVVGRERIESKSNYFEGVARFEVDVTSSGKLQFRAEIPRRAEELTGDNNRRTFYINALSNRMRVLVMAGPPDNSLGDLIRRLKRDERLELTIRSTKGGGFYEGEIPDRQALALFDIVILHHFPTKSTGSGQFNEFARATLESNAAICLIDGGDISLERLQALEKALPVMLGRGNSELRQAQVQPLRTHSILAEPDDGSFAERWRTLPPASFLPGAFAARPEASILASYEDPTVGNPPAIVIDERGRRKSAALLIRDLWRWGISSPGEQGIVEPLLRRLMLWLSIRRNENRVQVTAARENFTLQESIDFTVSVYDQNYQTLPGAEVWAKIEGAGREPLQMSLEPDGTRYRGSFLPWGEGDYRIAVRADFEGRGVGSDTARVIVEPFSVELLTPGLNEPLLREIAEASAGGYVRVDSAGSLIDSLQLTPVSLRQERRVPLFGGWAHLAIVIAILAVEWFIRIRFGML